MGSLSNLYISQSYQSLIHLGTNNTASANLIELQDGLGNSIGVAVNTNGDLFLSGSLTASLQQGYLYVGGANGKTTAFATSSLVTNINTGSLVTTSSFNSYTQSTNIRLDNLESTSASVNVSISNLNSTTASQAISISNLNASSASQQISIDNLNTNSASVNISISNINTATASLFDSASLALTTASFDNGTRNLTFTKGNNQTFSVNIPDVSGSAGDFVTTASFNSYTSSNDQKVNSLISATGSYATTSSFNAYTQSNDQRVSSLESNSASVNTSISNINTFTQSANISINALNAATSSYATSAITASSLITASVSLNTITFTKGDGTTFPITVNTGSGGGGSTDTGSLMVTGSIAGNILTFTKGDASTFNLTIPSATGSVFDTGSFATTGSNTFVGKQTINEELLVNVPRAVNKEFKVTWGNGSSASMYTEDTGGPSQNLVLVSASIDLQRGGISFTSGSIVNSGDQIQFNAFASASFTLRTQLGGVAEIRANTDYTDPNRPNAFVRAYYSGDIQLTGFGGGITISGSGTSIQGVDFIGFSSSVDTRIKASLVTGSVAGNVLTFTKGDATTFTLTVDTGSGGGGGTTYINPTLNPYSGSLILVANTFTSSSFAHISASANGQVNLVFKNNNNTPDTIISGSNNLFVNAAAPTAGFKRYLGGSGNIALNASNVPQISSSMAFSPTMNNNYFGGNSTTLIMRGPVSSSTYTISGNSILGTVSIGGDATNHARGIVSGLIMTGNQIAGTLTVIANKSNLSSSLTFSNNNLNGNATINSNSSSFSISNNNINDGALTLNNNFFSGSAGVGSVTLNTNNIGGASNTITIQGILPVGTTNTIFLNANTILGGSNTLFVDPTNVTVSGTNAYHSALRNIIGGSQLIVSGSSLSSDNNSLGSAYFGRYNANDGIRNKTSNIVFAVGTGNTTTRKTGFLIDSGSNTYVEGTLNVSGSTTMTGSITIQSGSGDLFVHGNKQFNGAQYSSLVTQSGSAAVSQSVTFDTTGPQFGVSLVDNTKITVANSGTYNIQFSAQLLADTGADNIFIWFKKNGTNIAGSATELQIANNDEALMTVNLLDTAVANDFYELCWQGTNGDAVLLSGVASGNVPAIPSIIATITQVR